jgi:hypothetical protein
MGFSPELLKLMPVQESYYLKLGFFHLDSAPNNIGNAKKS